MSAEILFDAAGGASSNIGSTRNTWAHTCSTDAKIIFVMDATYNRYSDTARYNGVSMTKIGTQGYGGTRGTMYYLLDPATGTNNVDLYWASGGTFGAGSVSYKGDIDTDSPIGVLVSTGRNSTAIDNTVACGSDDMIIDFCGIRDVGRAMYEYTGQTERWYRDPGTGRSAAGSELQATATTQLMGYWASSADEIIHMAIAIKATTAVLYQEAVAGLLALSGTLQSTVLWKRLVAGTVVLAGEISDFKLALSRFLAGALSFGGVVSAKASYFRSYVGTLAMSGTFAQLFRRQFKSIVGTVTFGGLVSDFKLSLSRFLAGTLTFSGAVIARLKKFVVAIVSMALSPITIVRAWLAPTADVDLD